MRELERPDHECTAAIEVGEARRCECRAVDLDALRDRQNIPKIRVDSLVHAIDEDTWARITTAAPKIELAFVKDRSVDESKSKLGVTVGIRARYSSSMNVPGS